MLSPRQRYLYTDRVNIWQQNNVLDATGEPQDSTYTLLYSNIPCKYEFTLNVDDPSDVGGFKRKSTFTTDILHLPLKDDLERTLTIPNAAWFVNVTPNNPNRRNVSIGQGAANILPGSGARTSLNKQVIQIMTEEHPPIVLLAGVP